MAICTVTNTSAALFAFNKNFPCFWRVINQTQSELHWTTLGFLKQCNSMQALVIKITYRSINYQWKLCWDDSNPRTKIASEANESLPSSELRRKNFPKNQSGTRRREENFSLAVGLLSCLMPIGKVEENGTEQFSICVPHSASNNNTIAKLFPEKMKMFRSDIKSRASFIKAHSSGSYRWKGFFRARRCRYSCEEDSIPCEGQTC